MSIYVLYRRYYTYTYIYIYINIHIYFSSYIFSNVVSRIRRTGLMILPLVVSQSFQNLETWNIQMFESNNKSRINAHDILYNYIYVCNDIIYTYIHVIS